MNIFDKGYPYKIKLLGYSLQNKEQEYIKANMYILTHGKIYTVSFISPIFGEHTLIISEGYDEIELFHAHFFGVCNEHLSMTHVNVTPEELLRNNIPNAHVIMKTIEEDTEIVASDYFALDMKNKKLVLYPEKFEQVPSTILLRKLIRA